MADFKQSGGAGAPGGGGGGGAFEQGGGAGGGGASDQNSGASGGRGAQQWLATMHAVIATAAQTTKAVTATHATVSRLTADMSSAARRAIGDLDSYIGKLKGPWAQELKLQLDALQVGGKQVDDFIAKWGDAVVTTEDGAKTIRSIFDKVDLRGLANQVDDLANRIRNGSATVAEGLTLLKDKGGDLTKQFVDLAAAFEKGDISIDRLLSALKALQSALGKDSAGAQLAQQITDALRNSTRLGGNP